MAKYISEINYPKFTRYLVLENRKYTLVVTSKTEKSYLYKLLEGEETDIDEMAINDRIVVSTLCSVTSKTTSKDKNIFIVKG
jgi:hypothetical protein